MRENFDASQSARKFCCDETTPGLRKNPEKSLDISSPVRTEKLDFPQFLERKRPEEEREESAPGRE